MVQTTARLYDQFQCVCEFYVADTNLLIRISSERGPCSSGMCFLQQRTDYKPT